MKLFRTKSIDQILSQPNDNNRALKKTLGRVNLVSLGIGAIIGAGIFAITGQAAAQYAGPAIVISFVISGFACAFAGLCYAEMASMIPISGSAYTYAYATMGEFVAWIIGWDLILEYLFASSTVAVGWSGYVISFLKDFGIHLPEKFTTAPISHSKELGWYFTGSLINLPAVLIILALTFLLAIGIKESAWFNNLMVIVKVLVIIVFILVGIFYVNYDNWQPFIPEQKEIGVYGWTGILRAAGIIFFAYIGFDAVSTAAQEAINPQRDMAYGILGSLFICTVLYVLFAGVLTGVVHYSQLNTPAPVAVAIDQMGKEMKWLKFFIKIGAIAGLSSAMLIMMLGQPRIFYAMGLDGLLPSIFCNVHPKFKTPFFSTIYTGCIASVLAGLLPMNILSELVSIGTLFAFIVVCAGVLNMRIIKPHVQRPFKVPYVWVIAPLGILTCFAQMYYLEKGTWLRLFAWMFIGLIIYFLYGYKASRLNKTDRENNDFYKHK